MSDNNLDNIEIYWTIPSYWYELTYEQKLEHYWKYQYKNGERIVPAIDETSDE